jgi:hypothetical protein
VAQGQSPVYELIPAVLVGMVGTLFLYQGVRGLRGLSFYLPRNLQVQAGAVARIVGVLCLLFGSLMLRFAYELASSYWVTA